MKVRVRFHKAKRRFEVSWQVPTGAPGKYQRRRLYRESRVKAEEEAAAVLERFKRSGVEGLQIDTKRWQSFLRLEQRLEGASLEEAVEFFLANRPASAPPTLEGIAAAYRESLAQRRLSASWQGMNERYLTRFLRAFPKAKLSELKTDALWGFCLEQGEAADTHMNARRVLVALGNYCLERGWLTRNLFLQIPAPRIVRPEPEKAEPAKVAALLEHLWRTRAELVPFAALRFFAGLRSSFVMRAEWEQIHHGRGILLHAEKTKAKRRAWLEGFPEALWAWLEPFKGQGGRIAAGHYQAELSREARRIGWELSRNLPRSSFATFHLAWRKDAALTALLMAHKESPRVLFEHYAGAATAEEGAAYFALRPPSVAELRRSPTSPFNLGQLYRTLPAIAAVLPLRGDGHCAAAG